jgi:GR25 family glycosyltransferase involved in LPS biosynthesis
MQISALTYINLDSRTDKLQNVKNQLENCPFDKFKTPGLTISNYDTYKLKPYLAKQNESKIKGHIGCVLAHLHALEGLVKLNNDPNDYSMILEDDVCIHPNFWKFVSGLDASQYIKSDLIFFDTINKHSPYGIFDSFDNDKSISIYVPAKSNRWFDKKENKHRVYFWGTHCYCIKNSFMEYAHNTLKKSPIDSIDMMYTSLFSTYHIQTGLVYQNRSIYSSDIIK